MNRKKNFIYIDTSNYRYLSIIGIPYRIPFRLFLGIHATCHGCNTCFERLYDPRMELVMEIVRVVRSRIEYAAKWPMEWLPSVLLPRKSIHRVVTIYEQLVPLPFDPHPRLPRGWIYSSRLAWVYANLPRRWSIRGNCSRVSEEMLCTWVSFISNWNERLFVFDCFRYLEILNIRLK